jgi:hypothetical protein
VLHQEAKRGRPGAPVCYRRRGPARRARRPFLDNLMNLTKEIAMTEKRNDDLPQLMKR